MPGGPVWIYLTILGTAVALTFARSWSLPRSPCARARWKRPSRH